MTNVHELHSGRQLNEDELQERSATEERQAANLIELQRQFDTITLQDALVLSDDVNRNLDRGFTEGNPAHYAAAKAMFAELMSDAADRGETVTDEQRAAVNNYLLFSDVEEVLRERDMAGIMEESLEEAQAADAIRDKKADVLRPIIPAELLRRLEYVRDHLEDYWGTEAAKQELDAQFEILDGEMPATDVLGLLDTYEHVSQMSVSAEADVPPEIGPSDAPVTYLHDVKMRKSLLAETAEARAAFKHGRMVPMAGNEIFNGLLDQRFYAGAERYRAKQEITLRFVREKVKTALAALRTQE